MSITDVVAYPLTTPIDDDQQRTSQGSFGTISIVVVEVRTDDGLVGYGEALARYAPRAYATLIDEQLDAAGARRGPVRRRRASGRRCSAPSPGRRAAC